MKAGNKNNWICGGSTHEELTDAGLSSIHFGPVEVVFARVEHRLGLFDIAGEARVLRTLVAVDEDGDIPGLLVGQQVLQSEGQIHFDVL